MGDDLPILQKMLGPSVDAMGYELLYLEYAMNGKEKVLRVYIDAPGGVRVTDCVTVSRQLSAILDVENPVDTAYMLEVSSPGDDRPLHKPEHFQRFTGNNARIVMNSGVNGRLRFTGELQAANGQGVVIKVDGECYSLAYDDIKTARLKPLF